MSLPDRFDYREAGIQVFCTEPGCEWSEVPR
jgi:hypothetical protein